MSMPAAIDCSAEYAYGVELYGEPASLTTKIDSLLIWFLGGVRMKDFGQCGYIVVNRWPPELGDRRRLGEIAAE